MTKYNAYFICTSPRSGSTLLCKLLSASGCAGHPKSYFHEADLGAWLSYMKLSPTGDSLRDLDAALVRAHHLGRAGGDLCGVRLQRHSFDFFMAQLARRWPQADTDLDRLTQSFGRVRFIHLHRPDVVAQAVSYVRAEQTGLWHRAADGSELERLAPPAPPRYDFAAIHAAVQRFQGDQLDWQAWFTAQGITPYRISYDALAADPSAVLAEVLADLGCDVAAAAHVTAPLARLADATNRDWIERYMHDANPAEREKGPA
ncbi:sulfotransferase [Epibacterium sp. SM1979]|uniref:Sulfotransferase n=1 Tax=Tritonibacter litoralis TaxID=2662264 RepID=A0A843YD97_9RHOB|nr:Stf0 family sulfotransferase [Tritonibacter litoralis]MQQ06857.1 sulfotransferase [Tritonibacter litoralis]